MTSAVLAQARALTDAAHAAHAARIMHARPCMCIVGACPWGQPEGRPPCKLRTACAACWSHSALLPCATQAVVEHSYADVVRELLFAAAGQELYLRDPDSLGIPYGEQRRQSVPPHAPRAAPVCAAALMGCVQGGCASWHGPRFARAAQPAAGRVPPRCHGVSCRAPQACPSPLQRSARPRDCAGRRRWAACMQAALHTVVTASSRATVAACPPRCPGHVLRHTLCLRTIQACGWA